MTISSTSDLDAMRRVGQLVAQTLDVMRAAVRPDVTTAELDAAAERFARALAAHHEHTIVVRHGRPLVLTAA